MSAGKPRECPFCREAIPQRAAACRHCGEPLSRTAWAGDLLRRGLLGAAAGLVLVATALRLAEGGLPDVPSMARSLRFLEVVAGAAFLLLLAQALRRRE